MKNQTKLLVLLVALTTVSAFAKDDIVKNARKGDVASQYILDPSGNLFRTVGNNKCQITNNVEDIKISAHPQDKAMIYFIKNSDLYVLHNADRTGQCPKASTKVITSNVAHSYNKKTKENSNYRYNVVSNTKTLVVNVVLDSYGNLEVWGDVKKLGYQDGIVDYSMYNYYNVKGKPFSSYVLFALMNNGCILKVDGDNVAQSKTDCERKWSSIKEFKDNKSLN
ncbi:MAG: hypothetical protein KA715_09150 [Xanthomonadaceae bacterium]|nr:hypothetical protein [Xanthomonadaceae bacterium]